MCRGKVSNNEEQAEEGSFRREVLLTSSKVEDCFEDSELILLKVNWEDPSSSPANFNNDLIPDPYISFSFLSCARSSSVAYPYVRTITNYLPVKTTKAQF